jgi:transcriptional regulator with XRE-family HTH domain
MNKFSIKIKEQRKAKRLSIRKCAEMAEISPTYLVRIEDGTTPPPSDKVIQKLSEVLDIDLNELNELANEYLEYLGKAKPENIRVPFSEELPAFLRTASKKITKPEDWQKLAKKIEEWELENGDDK